MAYLLGIVNNVGMVWSLTKIILQSFSSSNLFHPPIFCCTIITTSKHCLHDLFIRKYFSPSTETF